MIISGGDCSGRTISGVISAKNTIAIHGIGDVRREGTRSDFHGPVVINELLLRGEYECDIVRKLVNEMSSVFLANQRSPENPMNIDEVLYYSRSYRAVIKVAIDETQKSLMTQAAQPGEFLDDLMRTLVVSESSWSFAEIIFFQEPHGGELVGQLLKWLQAHINDCQLMLEEVLLEDPVDSHHNYWPAVYGCLLQGKVEETIHLLQATNNTSPSWLTTLELLTRMPIYQTAGVTITDFKMKWQHWQQEVKRVLNQGLIRDNNMAKIAEMLTGDSDSLLSAVDELSQPWYAFLIAELLYKHPYAKLHQVQDMLTMLTGDSDSLLSAVDELLQPWYAFLIAELLFKHPYAKLHQVQDMLTECVERCGGTGSFDTHDHLILSILKKHIIDVMKYSSEGFSAWWFAAHFSDVFYRAGYLHEKNSVGTNIRESLILEYGGSLMQDEGLWPVGTQYLSHCREQGRFHLQEYLTRISLTSTKKALKVFSLCEQYGFTQQAASICRVMARRELKEDRLGSALTWCRQGKDGNMATIVAERFLDKYREDITTCSTDVLDALGSTMLLISKKLLFLAKLREFHQLCDVGEEKEACDLLVTLITSRMAPVKYWFLLLLELLPMLESSKALFTTPQIYDLMNAISELQQSRAPEMMNDLEKNKVQSLQLALTRCLAKVTLYDSEDALLAIPCDATV